MSWVLKYLKEIVQVSSAVIVAVVTANRALNAVDSDEPDITNPTESPIAEATRLLTGRSLIMAGSAINLSAWLSKDFADGVSRTWLEWGQEMLISAK